MYGVAMANILLFGTSARYSTASNFVFGARIYALFIFTGCIACLSSELPINGYAVIGPVIQKSNDVVPICVITGRLPAEVCSSQYCMRFQLIVLLYK